MDVRAQPFCIDSSRVNPYYICNEPYKPQCGCDGKVYRSECAARYQGGLNNYVSFADGNCATFDYEILGTISGEGYLNFGIYLKEKASVYITIFDVYGHKKLEENLGFISPPSFTEYRIELNNFYIGMYVFVVQINGETKVKKFVKANER